MFSWALANLDCSTGPIPVGKRQRPWSIFELRSDAESSHFFVSD
ncbi:hypothetical protein BLL52_4315 [Rhodoferax antarcticus ANT.BR]|uniref:Uncharacterized protein n=1 Tax=Rhodoferax antarcticus ANT.BR TaxID=1111071 RepID=A0A1Q8Y9C4_9BURK|nr:hypothetical protein BLL52_4315 [Rhodoferax antarcticus ANT.BR]